MKSMVIALGLLLGGIAGCAGKGEMAKKPQYFEMKRDGVTYVFGNVETMQQFAQGGKVKTRLATGPNGEKVAYEYDGKYMENLLTKDYEKQHPKVASK